jgi:hypothetical protein
MILYHALPQKYLDLQLNDNGFTIKPFEGKHWKLDVTPAIWATEHPLWSYQASGGGTDYVGEDIAIVEIDTTDAPDMEVTNETDWVVKGRDYYLIRTSHIPIERIRVYGMNIDQGLPH